MLAGPFPRVSERPGNLGRSLGLVLDDRALDDCEAAIFFVVRGFVLSDEPPRELLVLHDQRPGLRDRNRRASSSSRFDPISTLKLVMPVTLPPGRLRLATSPS